MKRKYEKYELVVFISVIFVFILVVFLIIINKSRFRTYTSISAFVLSKHYIETYVTDYELKLIKNRNIVYIDNRKRKVKIDSVERNILKRKKVIYHGVMLKLDVPDKYKDNDYIKISLYQNKIKITRMFKSCWKEE